MSDPPELGAPMLSLTSLARAARGTTRTDGRLSAGIAEAPRPRALRVHRVVTAASSRWALVTASEARRSA